MAPRVEFNVEQIRDKSRKDLLYLLEGVRPQLPLFELGVEILTLQRVCIP